MATKKQEQTISQVAEMTCNECGAFGFEPHTPTCSVAIEYEKKAQLCLTRGHDWKEDGHCGPESGWIEMECQCCGESHKQILY